MHPFFSRSLAYASAWLLLANPLLSAAELTEGFDKYSPAENWGGDGVWVVEKPDVVALGPKFRYGQSGNGVRIGLDSDDTSVAPIYRTGLNLIDDFITASCRIQLPDQEGRFDFFTRGNDSEGTQHTLSHVVFEKGQILYGEHGGALRVVQQAQEQKWLKVTQHLNLKKGTYDLYINGTLVKPEIPFSAGPEVTAVNVDWVVFAKNAEGRGVAWVDDISVHASRNNSPDELLLTKVTSANLPPMLNLDLSKPRWRDRTHALPKGQAENGLQRNTLGAMISGGAVAVAGQGAQLQASPQGGVTFTLANTPPAKAQNQWEWKAAEAVPREGKYSHYTLRYKAHGISRRLTDEGTVTFVGYDAKGNRISVPVLDTGKVINDGKTHEIHGLLPDALNPESISIDLSTQNSLATLSIENVCFYQHLPPLSFGSKAFAMPPGFVAINLEPLFNDSLSGLYQRTLAKQSALQDGAASFTGVEILDRGIPFKVSVNAKNLVVPVEDLSPNRKTVPFLGAEIPRSNFAPVERADAVTVPVGRAVSELYLLLVNDFPAVRKRYATAAVPFQFDDILATFCVELRYQDGEVDLAFPYSIADGEYVIRRMMGSYVIPVDEKRVLKEAVLINRSWGHTVGLAAASVLATSQRRFAQLLQEPELIRVPSLPEPAEKTPFMERNGRGLIAGNRYYQFDVDLSNGFVFRSWQNHWGNQSPVAFSPDSGLKVLSQSREWDGRSFQVSSAQVEQTVATLILKSTDANLPLELTVRLTVDESPQLKTELSVRNTGSADFTAGFRFPSLAGITLGNHNGTWIYFPKYGNVNTNRNGFYEGYNDLQFPLQFFDIYNPGTGGGLAFLTHNRDDARALRYRLSKGDQGVAASIEYPEVFGQIKAGGTRELAPTMLVTHGGDWHEAFEAYRQWSATWYQPHNAQNKDWFINSYWVHTQIPTATWAGMVLNTPPMYNADTGVFHIKEVLQADEEVFGSKPDLMNLFLWSYSERLKVFHYAGSPEESYESLGGRESFSKAVQTIQGDFATPVSLYFYPGPCGKQTAFGLQHGAEVALIGAGGNPMEDATDWYACPGSKQWRDYFVETIRVIQKDTQAKVIYLDVFGFTDAVVCYSKNHDHDGPYSMNQGTVPLLDALRKVLPAEVVVWSEYSVNDIASQWTDGNITYYYLPVRDLICPIYNVDERAGDLLHVSQDIYRFAYPKMKQFGFPCGIEGDSWGHLLFPFFNGDGTFDTTWRLYTTRIQAFLAKALKIHRDYKDCFGTATPKPLIPTERAQVYANEFPGPTRTVWTVYNERFTTVRGHLLKVAHVEGATYRDLWNDTELVPEIRDGEAWISLKIFPQSVGAIVQMR